MLEIVPDRLTFQSMKKGPEEDYREHAVRWKNVASLVRPPFTNREENSMFVDTLPSPYYDILVVNAFVEFGDLMYSVGRIEDGIKREKIMDIKASTMENKRISLDKRVQTVFGEKESKRKSHRPKRSLSRIILVHHCMPKSPWSVFIRLKGLHGNMIKSLIQAIPEAIKGKGLKCTIHSQ